MSEGKEWKVCAGDATYVQVQGVAKPIACGSKERARLIAAAPDLLEALEALVNAIDFEGESGSIQFNPGTAYERDCLLVARRALSKAEA